MPEIVLAAVTPARLRHGPDGIVFSGPPWPFQAAI
jgi:hypothetical protein